MQDFQINVTDVEEWRTLKDKNTLEQMFARAKSAIVNGASVMLVRKTKHSSAEKFDEMTTLEDLEAYRKSVFKFIH